MERYADSMLLLKYTFPVALQQFKSYGVRGCPTTRIDAITSAEPPPARRAPHPLPTTIDRQKLALTPLSPGAPIQACTNHRRQLKHRLRGSDKPTLTT